ncbi:EAL domain-containing protein [Bradyrhizobium sp. ORS 285]|uniref:bifunctional diguanylate cyclase/phosphodiesterase n=1 Tax=Bradyrhizobium sp. ORS 285 TaxID=115808 RepID=UPI0002407EDB|nr:EAL domain-containing protein [Bradyrhizobium sp. ORS 285]CCD87988.1 putative signaling protein containing multidomains (CHASE/GGDE/EAL) [Bradyrhizobium sp. ORS 285]
MQVEEYSAPTLQEQESARIGSGRERLRASLSRYRLYRPAIIAACVGVVLSIAGTVAVGRWENRLARSDFEGLAEAQAILVQNGVNEYVSRLTALRTRFESANDDITRSEYQTFSARLFEAHRGMLRLAWLPRIKRKERGEYEAAAITDGVPAFRIKSYPDGTVAPESDEYYPVYFSTEAKTSPVYGLDYWSIPDHRAVLEQSRDYDMIGALRTRQNLINQNERNNAVMIGIPVYAKGTSRTTVADRRRNLSGFIVGVFDLPMLLQSVRANNPNSPALQINLLPPERVINASGVDPQRWPADPNIWSTTLRIGDADWVFQAAPAGGLMASHNRALALYAAGMATTIFLAVYLALSSRNALQLALANRRVLELAQTDALTGLANRAFFLEEMERINDEKNGRFTVFLLDLDRFKNVNDSLGHGAGDELLVQVAQRLRSQLRDEDVLARLGGDEFALIQAGFNDQRAAAIELAQRITRLIAEPFQIAGQRVEIGTSIGISLAPQHGRDQEHLLKKADLALYRSKSAGRSCYTMYDDAMSAELEARNTLEGDLRDAIAQCQFEVHYQPFYDADTRQRRGVEALVRWRHPVKGLVPPDKFIPLAESTGLIVPLGEWIIGRACDDATAWPDDVKVAVNLSPVQFKQAELFDVIQSALARSGLDPKRLEIEITESVLLERAAENESFIDRLKGLGISLALDDFGTGYSSLRSLTAFPFNKIKIDKSFVANLSVRDESAAVISSVVTLARGLGIQITAEGVETEEQLSQLRALGVNFAQGYLLGRPMPVEQLEQHLDISRTASVPDEDAQPEAEASESDEPRPGAVVALIPRSGALLSLASNG